MVWTVARMAVLAAVSTAILPPVHAELGGMRSSIDADRTAMAATVTSHPMGRFVRHELTRPNGGQVREMTNADGQVFAVTWSGPGRPDLRRLLGRYFAAYQAANRTIGPTMHGFRRPPRLSQSDLQIQAGGHLGWFHGVAFVPSLAPPGFSVDDLRTQP